MQHIINTQAWLGMTKQQRREQLELLKDSWEGLQVSKRAEKTGATVRTYFKCGVYAREITIPANVMMVSERHIHGCIGTLSKGTLHIANEDGIVKLQAPSTIVSEGDQRRIVFAEDEVVFTTYHACDEELSEEEMRDLFTANESKHLEDNDVLGLRRCSSTNSSKLEIRERSSEDCYKES